MFQKSVVCSEITMGGILESVRGCQRVSEGVSERGLIGCVCT